MTSETRFLQIFGYKILSSNFVQNDGGKTKRKTSNARDCSLMRWRFFWFVGIILLAEPKLHLWPVDWPSQRLRSSGWLSDLKPIIQNDNTGLLHTPQQKRPELFSRCVQTAGICQHDLFDFRHRNCLRSNQLIYFSIFLVQFHDCSVHYTGTWKMCKKCSVYSSNMKAVFHSGALWIYNR